MYDYVVVGLDVVCVQLVVDVFGFGCQIVVVCVVVGIDCSDFFGVVGQVVGQYVLYGVVEYVMVK